MSVAVTATPGFRIGRVVRNTVRVGVGSFWTLFPLGALWAICFVLLELLLMELFDAQQDATGVIAAYTMLGSSWGLIPVWAILNAAAMHASFQNLMGRRPSAIASLFLAMSAFASLVTIQVLYYFAMILGLILLIVPGLIVTVRWSMAIPARMIEGKTVMGGLSRSAQLTRGYGWPVFAVIVISYGANYLFALAISAVTAAIDATDGTTTFFSSQGLGQIITGPIAVIVIAASTAATYCELRVSKEGIGPEALASVFD
jgi:hypothetical protein